MRKTLKEVLESWLHSLFGCRWRCNFIRQATRQDRILHGNSVYMLERFSCGKHKCKIKDSLMDLHRQCVHLIWVGGNGRRWLHRSLDSECLILHKSSFSWANVFKFLPLGSCRYSVLTTPPWVYHFPLGQPRAPGESNEIHRTYMWTFCMYR